MESNHLEDTCPDIPRGQPLDELFAELTAPLLLLWGIRDPWINAPGRRSTCQRHAPEATTEVVLEAGHCPHDEVPDQVNTALLQWLEGLKSAVAPTNADLLAKGVK